MLYLLAALFGLLIGSFLNVCIYRLPRDQSVVWPASRCTTCGRALSWYENIPVVSYLALRGRCRTCGERISLQYPIVELLTAAIVVGALAWYGLTPLFAVRAAFACAMLVLFVVDLQHQILPNEITLPGILAGLAASFFLEPGWRSALAGAVAGAASRIFSRSSGGASAAAAITAAPCSPIKPLMRTLSPARMCSRPKHRLRLRRPIPEVLIKIESALPFSTTLKSPATIFTPAARAASAMLSATFSRTKISQPSSTINPHERKSGVAPSTARSLTVPQTASLPISPPGKKSGDTTYESVVKHKASPSPTGLPITAESDIWSSHSLRKRF